MAIKFEEECTIHTIASIKNRLLNELHGSSDIQIDLGDVEEIDLTFLQILLAYTNKMQALNSRVRIVNIPKDIEKTFKISGFSDLIIDNV